MRKKSGFLMREVAGRFVVVPVDAGEHSFKGMVQMNKVGGFLWKKLDQEQSKDQLVQALLEKYDVTEEQAKKDVEVFTAQLLEAGILEA